MENKSELKLTETTCHMEKNSVKNLSVVFEKVLLSISGILFLIGTFLTFINIVLRKAFSKPWTGMEELDSIMLVMLVFLPLAYLEWNNRHLAVTVLFDKLPIRVQFWCRKFQHLTILILTGFLVTATWDVVARNMLANNKSAALGIPLYLPYLILLVGFGLAGIVKCVQLVMPEHRGDRNDH